MHGHRSALVQSRNPVGQGGVRESERVGIGSASARPIVRAPRDDSLNVLCICVCQLEKEARANTVRCPNRWLRRPSRTTENVAGAQ